MLSLVVRGGELRLLLLNGSAVLWHQVVPLNPAFMEGGVISQPRQVANAIKAVLERMEAPRGLRCVAALPGFHALTAVVDLPKARDVRSDRVLPREARRLFSYRPESSVLSWWPVPAAGPDMRRYLIVVTRRAAIRAIQEVAAHAGLRLQAIECEPLAAVRAANTVDGVLIQAESDGGDVVVVKSGAIGFVRSAFWGGGIVDHETLMARIIDLAERSIDAHNEANAGGPLNGAAPVYMAGAAAEAIRPQVAEALGRPFAEITPPLEYDSSLPAGELASNLGIVLRGVR